MWDNTANLSTAQQRQLVIDLLSARHKRVFPLSLTQQRLWFLNQLDPGTSAYNVPLGIRLQGNLDRLALGSSLQAIVHRHEILRTTFGVDAGRPIQIVAPDLQLEIPFVDLTDADSNKRQSEAYRIARAEARIPFDLAAGPLLRLRIIRLSADEHLLICILHHIVCDGWSLEIFIRELATLYGQYSEERNFHCQRFRAPVLLFRRAKQPYFKIRDQEMGWGARSAARLRVCAFNVAMHEDMLREPAVEMLAVKLQEALAEHRSDTPQAVPANRKC